MVVAFLLQMRKWMAFSTEPFPGQFPLSVQLRAAFSTPAGSGKQPSCPPEKGAQAAGAHRRSGSTSGFPFSDISTAKAGGGTLPGEVNRMCRNSPAANESEPEQPKLRGPSIQTSEKAAGASWPALKPLRGERWANFRPKRLRRETFQAKTSPTKPPP